MGQGGGFGFALQGEVGGSATPLGSAPPEWDPPPKPPALTSGSLAAGSGSELISGFTLRSSNVSQLGKPCQKSFSRLFFFQANVIGERAKVELLEPGSARWPGPLGAHASGSLDAS